MNKLVIRHVWPEPSVETWEHGVIWSGIDKIELELGDMHWYGGGALAHQQWPLEKLAMYPAPFITSDNGHTGLLGSLHPFWWTSTGAGVLVEDDDLTVSFNSPLTGQPHHQSFTTPAPLNERPLLSAQQETDHVLCIQGKALRLRFFECETPRHVVEAFWQLLQITDPPPDELIENPLWTTWVQFKNDISHDKILAYARRMAELGFPRSLFGIDAKWQKQFGDTQFDRAKFPHPQATVAELRDLGTLPTVWCVPFFMTDCQHFEMAVKNGFVIKNPDGSHYMTTWWEGQSALLDVTNPAAMAWHLDNLKHLAEAVNLHGFKFDAGEAMFYHVPNTIRHDNGSPNRTTHLYIRHAATQFAWSDVRAAWRNQAEPMLIRQWDKSTHWGFDNGLASCITQSMTLHLLGYPYSFPDMIGGNQYGEVATPELMIRWTQAVAPMPIIQFSLAPWDFGDECTQICLRYTHLHQELAERNKRLAVQKVPIVRPLWWIAPRDENALVCDDEYLIGDDLLVAPVIIEGARQRDIYLPAGQWVSYWDKNERHAGGQWLRDYPAPLDVLPLFERRIN